MKNKQTEKQRIKAKYEQNQFVKKTKGVTEYIRVILGKTDSEKMRLDIFLSSAIFM